MRPFLKFILSVIIVLLLSAVLAPILFHFLPFKFERIFNRLVMIFTLLAVLWFVRIRRETFSAYGISWTAKSIPQFLGGFLTALTLLSIFLFIKFGAHLAVWKPAGLSFLEWTWQPVSILSAAILISTIEEFFFRGFIFSALHRNFNWNIVLSLIVTNLFYSLLHFINRKSPFIGPDPNFFNSLQLITAPFLSFATGWQEIWPGVIGLFLFGLVLNDIFLRTQSLYPAIGLHAGCIFFIKFDRLFVEFMNGNTLLWGNARMYDGVVGWFFLLLMGFFLRMIFQRKFRSASLGLLIFLMGIQSTPLFAVSSESRKNRIPEKTIYSFSEKLGQAETSAESTSKMKEKQTGTWQEDHFVFKGLGPQAEIKIFPDFFQGKPVKVIQWNPLQKTIRHLNFQKVPPGEKLVLYYKASTKESQIPYFYMTLWAGRHEIKRIRIAGNQKEWKKEEIDLGVISFLKKPVLIQWDLSSGQPALTFFSFFAEIKK